MDICFSCRFQFGQTYLNVSLKKHIESQACLPPSDQCHFHFLTTFRHQEASSCRFLFTFHFSVTFGSLFVFSILFQQKCSSCVASSTWLFNWVRMKQKALYLLVFSKYKDKKKNWQQINENPTLDIMVLLSSLILTSSHLTFKHRDTLAL